MTISIWRYSHLTLAISSALFIILASITGIILAFEPISDKLNPYKVVNVNDVTISETISTLQKKYGEVITIEIDENNFVTANVIVENGKSDFFYINPKTGEKIGDLIEKKAIFKFATNLHRSLFLKSTGRFIVGFVSFLLFLIAITGIILIAKRQGGFSKILSKIVKENFNQYYHILIGRYTLVPIIIITITGVYLSLEKFSLLPKDREYHQNIQQEKAVNRKKITDFEIFKTTTLAKVKKLEFPFSTDQEDYFYLKLQGKEVAVHQFTGQIISQKKQSFVAFGSYYSLILHTGKGSILWSLILLLSCISILFFIFSGFSMTLKRKKKQLFIKNHFTKDDAEFIILVGSETGNTFVFANLFYEALIKAKKTVFLSDLNHYSSYKKAQNIIIFTATYGDGEAPVNARKFLQKINKIPLQKAVKYSVLGFGSVDYKEYCKYAFLVDSSLQLHKKFIPTLPLYKVNNQSFNDFVIWQKKWSENTKIDIDISEEKLLLSYKKDQDFLVLNKTAINKDNTFLVQLKPIKKTKFESGDLISITPKNETRNRLYSIGKINDTILLSIRKHEFGICSNYLSNLNKGEIIRGSIQQNKKFHFPKKSKEVILIANGTGVAPFLGMIQAREKNRKIHLFWGGRTKESLDIYKNMIDLSLENKTLTSFHKVFSREQENKIYVQDIILEHSEFISSILKNGNSIMICGSLNMQKGVLKTLEEITKNQLKTSLKPFKKNNQIKTDCY